MLNPRTREVLVGAAENIPASAEDAQPFAVSVLAPGGDAFRSLAPEQVVQNGALVTNPLHGAHIRFIRSIQQGFPFVVTENEPNVVSVTGFLRRDPNEAIQRIGLVQTNPLLDSNGMEADEIIGVFTQGNAFLAAVTPQGQAFGNPGSGIASGVFFQDNDNDFVLDQANVFHVIEFDQPQALLRNNRPLSQFFNDKDQPVVFTDCAGGVPTYTGFSLESGSQLNAGARSVLVGNTRPIVDENALAPDSIVGTNQPNTSLFVHALQTTMTSTRLTYLIVNGGVGGVAPTRKQVFALPIVNDAQQSTFGMVAAKGVEPQPEFQDGDPARFLGLQLSQAASTQAEMWEPNDPDVRVGGDRELPGAVTDMWVDKDAVFVAVPEHDGGSSPLPPGVYTSQAICNASGRIIGWTNWMPAAGAANQSIDSVIFDGSVGQFILTSETPVGDVGRTRVQQASGVLRDMAEPFAEVGGVQGFIDIPFDHPALSQTPGQRISLSIATGLQSIVIAQTGCEDSNNRVVPVTAPTLTQAEAGAIPAGAAPTGGFVVTGGALEELGATVTADIGTDGTNGWLVVGGSDGVAILQAQDGTGWPAAGLQKDFNNLPSLQFRRLGNITRVRKVTIDGDRLYVLTEDALYRIPLSAVNLAQEAPQIQSVAQATTLCNDTGATLSDVVVSGTRAWLATNCGLFQTTSGVDVRNVQQEDIWQQIPLAGSVGPVTRLFAISPTHRSEDVATTDHGGAIYALSAHVSTFQAQLYRLAIAPKAGLDTSSTQVTALYPDFFTDRGKSYLFARGNYRNFVYTDGAIWLTTRSRYAPVTNSILAEMLPTNVRSGVPFIAMGSGFFFTLDPARRINQPLRVSASGSLLVSGDFGIYVQQ